MDEDGKKGEEHSDNNAPGNQLPASGQHSAASGAVQQEEGGAGSGIQQNKEAGVGSVSAGVKASKKTSDSAYSEWDDSKWYWPMEG